jgi:hypothetical protein
VRQRRGRRHPLQLNKLRRRQRQGRSSHNRNDPMIPRYIPDGVCRADRSGAMSQTDH